MTIIAQEKSRRLTTNTYWNSLYSIHPTKSASQPFTHKLTRCLLGSRMTEFLVQGGYSRYLLFDGLFARHLPKGGSRKVVEIGSAPGKFLLRFHQKFGYEPFGVEYTADGVQLNKRLFAAAGLNPDNVWHEDAGDPEFLARNRESFDVVYSFGLIEHFSDPKEMIRNHVELLAPGGHLVIVIPNLRGVNLALTRFFHRDLIALHNLEIMSKKAFRSLFSDLSLLESFCGYAGLFTLGLQNTKQNSWKRRVLRMARIGELPFELLQWLLLRRNLVTNWLTSPYLVYVGQKSSGIAAARKGASLAK